jgi:hypothetical protein
LVAILTHGAIFSKSRERYTAILTKNLEIVYEKKEIFMGLCLKALLLYLKASHEGRSS